MTQSAFTPPSGINYHCKENVPIAALSKALCQIAAFLQSHDPHAQLRRYEDWWEHDGLHFDRGALDIRGLFEVVESPRSLFAAMQGDESVFVGIAPSVPGWYLRFYADWDDDGQALEGRFDITLPETLASSFEANVIENLEIHVEQCEAQAYYLKCRV
jgi:hypothetical protein